MRRRTKLPSDMKDRIERKLKSLENVSNITVDQVSDKEIFSAFHINGIKQSSFQVQKITGSLKATNGDIAVPVNEYQDGLEEEIKEFAVGNPDRCGIQSRLEGNGKMCIISYKNRDYERFIRAVEKFSEDYESEFL